ncbi:unnamed protein product [Rotaria sordida]|uniref:Uncharacterized protein n=1 Tax=Rotaria sordida TaxID=392033 RepID=A0A818P7W5_9BILA|nr:unnamed protein product [Rotaria sordida]CAF1273087.1 unnamed protein product [Rotaria sordida]CAF3616150.1 unnamed protein product [Rotaria sordida]
MSLCSCSLCSSSLRSSKSNNSYCLLSSSLSSITTVSSQLDNEVTQRNLISDNEQWPAPPVEETQLQQSNVQDNWQIEKNISLKDQQSNKNRCILKATMTNEQILICDSSSTSSTRSQIIPGKHVSMKVVFHF